jgi:hypothetical protein
MSPERQIIYIPFIFSIASQLTRTVHPSIHSSIHPTNHPSIYLSTSIHPSTHLSVFIYPSIHLLTQLFPLIHPHICLLPSIHLFTQLSIYLSIHLSNFGEPVTLQVLVDNIFYWVLIVKPVDKKSKIEFLTSCVILAKSLL